jgi:hypothetical protein
MLAGLDLHKSGYSTAHKAIQNQLQLLNSACLLLSIHILSTLRERSRALGDLEATICTFLKTRDTICADGKPSLPVATFRINPMAESPNNAAQTPLVSRIELGW